VVPRAVTFAPKDGSNRREKWTTAWHAPVASTLEVFTLGTSAAKFVGAESSALPEIIRARPATMVLTNPALSDPRA
jgi:hypothetical protein